MAFFICKNLFKYIQVVCSGNNGGIDIIFENTTKYDKISVEKI